MTTSALPGLPRPRRLPDPAAVRARVSAIARAARYYAVARPARQMGRLATAPARWLTARAYHPRYAAVQGHGAYASVVGIDDDCLHLRTGEYRAVLEVDGIGWRRMTEADQDALIDTHAWVCNSLTHPVQWTVLTRSTDLEVQAAGMERRADAAEAGGLWPERYTAFVRDKAAFTRTDGRRRQLKRRRFLLTIPTEHLDRNDALEELDERAGALIEQMERLGLKARRLTTPELGVVVYEQWHPGVVGSGGGQVPFEATEDEWRWAAADLTLPGRVERHGDDLRVLGETPDGEYWTRTLVLSWWPSQVAGLWLWPLIESRQAIDLSLHITPLDDQERKTVHRDRLQSLEDARAWFATKLPLPGRELAVAHTQRMGAELEEGAARAFHVSLYALLRAPTRKGLDEAQRRVQREIKGLLARSRRARGEPDRAFLSCRPEGTDALAALREHDTWAVAHSFVPATASLTMEHPDAYLYGYDGDQAVIWNRFDESLTGAGELNAATVVVAPPGGGKSTWIKRQIPEEIARGVGVTVFDIENEYAPISDLLGPEMAQDIVPDGTTGHTLNVFELPPPDPHAQGRDRNPVYAQTLAVKGLLDVALKELHSLDLAMLDRAILATYASEPWGIRPGNPASWAAPNGVPDLAALSQQLLKIAAKSTKSRDIETANVLASRLEPFITGTLSGLFTGQQTVSLDKPFVRFNLSGIGDELYPLVSYLCSTWLWTEQRRRPHRRVFVADEAWRWRTYAPLRLFMQDLARRGRKWLLAPVFVFHSGDDFNDDETRVVLQCSSMQYVMRQNPMSIDATARVFKLSAGDKRFLLQAKKGEGLFYARGTHVALTLGEVAPCEAPLVLTGVQAQRVRSEPPAPTDTKKGRPHVRDRGAASRVAPVRRSRAAVAVGEPDGLS